MRELVARLGDIVAIPVTPFDVEGVADEERYAQLLDRTVNAGIGVLTPNGNTSEFYALSTPERQRLLQVSGDVLRDRALIVAGIGLDTRTALEDARVAADAGARAVMIHQPVHPYVSREGWLDYHATIADGVPDLGVVLYVRNTLVDGALIRRLWERCPNLVGVKYAVADPGRFAQVRADAGVELCWIAGLAEPYAISYFAHGATGFTSGLVTVNPHLSLDLLASLRSGDFATARALVARIARFEELRAADGNANNVSVVKEALRQLGLAEASVRPPSSLVDPAVADEVAAILADWGRDYDLATPGRRELSATA